MKKVLYCLIGIISFLVFVGCVSANSCSLEERVNYTEIASRVKVTYEGNEVKNVVGDDPIEGTYYTNVLDLKIYNVTSDLLLELSDGINKIELDSKKADKDGVITVRFNNVDEIKNYTLEIYPSAYNCYTNKVRTMTITLPKFNYDSVSDLCEGISDYYLCEKYILSDVSNEYFNENVKNYREKMDSQSDKNNLFNEDDNNSGIDSIVATASKYKYLIAGSIITLGIIATIVVLKKKGSATK